MRAIFFILTTLFLSGCFLEKDINNKSAQDYLNNNKLYIIDDISESYISYEFYANQVIKNIYSDRELTNLIDIKIYEIDYNDKITLKSDENIYKCNFHINDNKTYMGISCQSTINYKTIFIGGWKSLYYAYFGE